MPAPVIAIVGRPNVGKSTLFNRLVGGRRAIVAPTPGVTRDRHVGRAVWGGRELTWVDTGGWLPEAEEALQRHVTGQVLEALRECDLVLLVTDAREGLHPLDEMLAEEIRRLGLDAPVLLAANKAESELLEAQAQEFARLGFEGPYPISAQEGRGLGELLDAILRHLPPGGEPAPEEEIRIAVVGQPNVGKSSLVNRLLGQERMIVDPRPGTTRDAVDSVWKWHGRRFLLVDTAGLRRRPHSLEALDFYSTVRALRALERAHVAFFLVDASRGLTRQDQRVAGIVRESGRAVVILVNKWDLVPKTARTAAEMETRIREAFPFLDFAPILFVSALTGQRLGRLGELVVRLYERWRRSVPTREVMKVLEGLTLHAGEPRIKVPFARQVATGPPTFALFVKDPSRVRASHLRFLEDRLRARLGLEGVPIRLQLRGPRRRTGS
jgi:GTP-binding protein